VFYDNDAVKKQFEPLDGVISFKKKLTKQNEDTIDEKKFFKKYRVHVRSVIKSL
jgi:hypothetical protein